MKDLWPSASRFWNLIKPGSETVNNPDPDSFRPQNQRSRTQNPKQTRPQPPVERGWVTKPTAAHPSGGPVAGGAIGTSGMPLTVQQRTPPGPPTRYWRKTRSTWNGAETTAAANSVGVSSSRTRIQRSSRSGVRTGWWVMSRFRSGCRVIRVEPCNGGVVGHPSPGGTRLAFRRKSDSEYELDQDRGTAAYARPLPSYKKI